MYMEATSCVEIFQSPFIFNPFGSFQRSIPVLNGESHFVFSFCQLSIVNFIYFQQQQWDPFLFFLVSFSTWTFLLTTGITISR